MATININSEKVIIGDYKHSGTKEAGVIISDGFGDIVIKSYSISRLDVVIAALERAKIELDRMNYQYIADEPVKIKYHKVLSK